MRPMLSVRFVTPPVFLAVYLLIQTVSSSKILITGVQLRSHMFEQLAVAEELVSRGHDVYYAVASRYERIASVEKKGIKVLTYVIPLDVPYFASDDTEKFTTSLTFDTPDNVERMKRQVTEYPLRVIRDCTYMMEDEAFMAAVKSVGFDIAIVEPFVLQPCSMILPKHLGLPFVALTAYYFPWNVRIPALPSFYPTGLLTTNRNLQNFKDRVGSFVMYLMFEFNLIIKWDTGVELLEKYAVGVSSWKELLLEAELFILTADHLLDSPLPLMPNFIRIPGLTCEPSQPLPDDLEQLMTAAKEGVILMTFGSSITGMPDDIMKKFLDAFAQLKQTVIAKLRVPEGWTVPDNVHIRTWLPQNDILGHPNTRLFITHGGNGGQYEALYHGVPMLGFPLFAEQHTNAFNAAERGFSLVIDIHNFTSSELFIDIQEILTNINYTTAIQRMSAVLHDEPMNSREKASFWIEHVIKHGGKHLRSVAMDMPTYQFLMIDVIALVFVILLLFLITFTFLVICIVGKVRSKNSVTAETKMKRQ